MNDSENSVLFQCANLHIYENITRFGYYVTGVKQPIIRIIVHVKKRGILAMLIMLFMIATGKETDFVYAMVVNYDSYNTGFDDGQVS